LKELGAPAGYKAVAPPHIRIPTGQNRSSDPGTKRA
jgi:hypothetical protein